MQRISVRVKNFLVLVRLVLLTAITSTPAGAQQTAGTEATGAVARRASASHTPTAPVIDGVIDERAWQDATPIGTFVQTEPVEGQPATELTDVRVLYDDNAIYVGVVCFDSDPSRIVTVDSRRDAALSGQDSFQIVFDTYHDRQNGFIFGTTPLGIEYDAQVRNEGEMQSSGASVLGRTGGGSGGGLNVNWDGSWEVKTQVTTTGWTAEFRRCRVFTTSRGSRRPASCAI
jgi:hypothetical protein